MEDMIKKKDPGEYAKSILDTAVSVITRPLDFYRAMPRSGGFVDPLIFLVVVSFASAIIQAFFSVVGIGVSGGFGLASLIITPVVVAIFGFVGAAIMFVVWKLMGSEQSYEVAYRCTAYGGAIGPITTLAQGIPYIGALVGIVWGIYLMIIASTEVHGIEQKKARTVLGAIAIVLALLSLSAEYSARKLSSQMADLSSKIEQMSPEEAGKKMGEFLKGMQKGAKE